MDLAAQFKEFLVKADSSPSLVTIKNYLSDVNKFIRWFEADSDSSFDPSAVSKSVIDKYKEESLSSYSLSSVERGLSSLRKFFQFLKLEGFISNSPFTIQPRQLPDPWKINDFKNHLYVFNSSYLTIKNYVIDVKQFASWAEAVLPPSQDLEAKPIDSLSYGLLEEYKKRLFTDLRLSPLSVNRKLSSLRKYLSWAKSEGLIKTEPHAEPKPVADLASQMESYQSELYTISKKETYSAFPPFRLFQKAKKLATLTIDYSLSFPLAEIFDKARYLHWVSRGRPVFGKAQESNLGIKNFDKEFFTPAVSPNHLPIHRKIWFHLQNTRPAWYLTLDSMGFIRFAKFAGFVMLVSIFSFSFYSRLNPPKKEVLSFAKFPTAANRTFVGRLTDNFGNPVISTTSLRLGLYNNKSATGSALLWQENVTVTPDRNGQFSVVLGENTFLPTDIFTQNMSLWLGVTIRNTIELTPRQKISTVDLSADSETLQGLSTITNSRETRNVILALNSSGNLLIEGQASPTFQASGGTFSLAGKALVFKTISGSGGNIILSPDGSGTIDLQSPILNSLGTVSINDLLSILATDSAQAAVTINQLSHGNIISASSSGVLTFSITNEGNLFAKGTFNGLKLEDGKVISGIWKGEAVSGEYGGTGTSSYDKGDILYADSSNSLSKLKVGTNGACLISNGTIPVWGSCEATSISRNSEMAAFVINQQGSGNILAASTAGQTSFLIRNDGSILFGESISSSGSGATNDGSPATVNAIGDSGSLIPNSSFETSEGDGVFARGWIVAASSSGLVAVDDSDAIHGQRSALVNLSSGSAAFYSPCIPISSLTNNYNLQWYSRQAGEEATVRGYLDQYTSKVNCNTNHSPVFSQAIAGTSNSSWSLESGSSPSIASGSRWGRIHFFVACETCTNSNVWIDGVRLVESTLGSGLDYAENYPADPTSLPEAGDVVSLTRVDGQTVVKKADQYPDPKVIGVVSTNPGQVLDNGTIPSPKVAIALSGRVPVKVSAKNGPIQIGDLLTSSDTPGIAVKAKNGGPTIGVAMEPYNDKENGLIGRIMMFVKNNSNSPSVFTDQNVEAKSANFDSLNANQATIDGTLRAKEIIAEHLSLSPEALATLSAVFAKTFSDSAETTLFQLTVADRLFVGPTLSLADNSINVLGSNLEIQPLKMGGVSFVGGQVKIDVDGNLRVGGNLVAEKDLRVLGKILANILTPLSGQDLVIELGDRGDDNNSQFVVKASHSAVLSINKQGDLQSLGDASFNKLSLSQASEFIVVSNTEIVATGAAGTAQIKDGENQLTIRNPFITGKSLIYVTPKIPDAILYIINQSPEDLKKVGLEGSFTVGISQILGKNVPFNWIIIN